MSASGNGKFILLPINAQDMDGEASDVERLLKKIIVHDTEVLACSDRSFFYIDLLGVRYLVRDNLYNILSDPRLTVSPMIKALRRAVASTGTREKPFIAYSLLSTYLPEHLFYEVENTPMPIERLVEILVEYPEAHDVVELCECRETSKPGEKASIYRMFYGSFLDALELLGVKYKYGETDGEPCIVLDNSLGLGVLLRQ